MTTTSKVKRVAVLLLTLTTLAGCCTPYHQSGPGTQTHTIRVETQPRFTSYQYIRNAQVQRKILNSDKL